jgi:hypothetical protein
LNRGFFTFFLHTSMTMLSVYDRTQNTKLFPLPADIGAVSTVQYQVFLDMHRLAEWNSWVRVTRSLALYVCFVDRCLSFCTFSFGHCILIAPLISSNSSYTITLDDHRFFFSLFFLVFLCYWVRVAPSLDEELCRSSFVLLHLAIVLSVLRWSPLISRHY